MIELIENYITEINAFKPENEIELENFRIKYLGKKGILNDLFEKFKTIPPEQKKEIGQKLNLIKNIVTEKVTFYKEEFSKTKKTKKESFDYTLPVDFETIGSRHPLSIVRNRIIEIFERAGFNVSYGPEIEDDWHNFTALNFPPDHPARDMQDTFFIEKNPDITLRTHTSSVQVRIMETTKPPIKTISPGRVYRNEAISARAHCFFHQVEGLYIDTNVSFADLKQILLYFAKEIFDEDTTIRLRPSFFPFTEPSAEMDISCNICKGKGCQLCKYSGWVEILGCGMVDPNVLKNCGINPEIYSGYAFGMGIERIANLLFSIKDIRMFSENDIRFLKQFKGTVL